MKKALFQAFAITLTAAAMAWAVNALRPDALRWPAPDSVQVGSKTVAENSRLLTTQQAMQMLTDGHVVFADARSAGAFQMGHIPGAISLPAQHMDSWMSQLLESVPADRKIVAYCASAQCHLAAQLVTELQEAGYQQVYHFVEGMEGWLAAGYSVETR